jgi:hypothetical protein
MSQRTIPSQEISPDAMRAYRAAKALHRDGGTPASAFGLLAAIVEDRTWERLSDNEEHPFTSFTAFVEAAEPGGLGTTRVELVKLLSLRHPHEDGAEWKVRAPWLREQVAKLLNQDVDQAAANGLLGRGRVSLSATQAKQERHDSAAITARLKRDDPELAAQVVAGEITPNAAAREKGWRKPRIVLSTPASVAIRLRQHWTPDQITELCALLNDPKDPQ